MSSAAVIRWTSVLAVAAVAVIAGWVSYIHAWSVVSTHGETGLVGRLYPGTIDGLIYTSSMVLLDAARRGMKAPSLARWLLGAGIAATLFANVLAGLGFGLLGAAVAAWPAAALVGSYELLMLIVRAHAQPALPPRPLAVPFQPKRNGTGPLPPAMTAEEEKVRLIEPPDMPAEDEQVMLTEPAPHAPTWLRESGVGLIPPVPD